MNSKKIVIYSHNGHNATSGGWDEELVNYLLHNHYQNILHIRFPFGMGSLKSVRLFFYNNDEKKLRESLIKFSQPEIISYCKDLMYGFFYGFIHLKNIDLFVGTNNLFILVGLFFKRIGFVKKVAYVVVDYTPVRFSNKFINSLYYFLDKIACYHSDIVWPFNKIMLEGRAYDKRIDLKNVNFQEAPFGNHSLSFKESDYDQYNKNRIVYFGNVIKSKGCELFIPMVKSLLAAGMEDFVLEVIGEGDVEYLKKEITSNNLDNYIKILGRIEDQAGINNILLTCGVAIAPYYSEDKNSFSYYADPGKVKIYLGCGLPVVITDVPPIAQDIMDYKAGLIARYDADDFADKILKIQKNYEFYRNHAILFGKKFDWNIIFNDLFGIN